MLIYISQLEALSTKSEALAKFKPRITQIARIFWATESTENAEIISFFINGGLARIKGKKMKNLRQSLVCTLRHCNHAVEAENAQDPFEGRFTDNPEPV